MIYSEAVNWEQRLLWQGTPNSGEKLEDGMIAMGKVWQDDEVWYVWTMYRNVKPQRLTMAVWDNLE